MVLLALRIMFVQDTSMEGEQIGQTIWTVLQPIRQVVRTIKQFCRP